MRLTGPLAIILAALIAILGIAIGAFLNPLAEKIINSPKPTPNPELLTIEEIPQEVFAYADTSMGGWGAFWLIYDEPGLITYRLDYWLPPDKSGYTGLAFLFHDGENLSTYNSIECVIMFSQSPDEVDLYFKDIAGNFNTVRITANNTSEIVLRQAFTNFPNINFNAVKEFGIVVNSEFSTGGHQVRIKNVKFVK